MQWKLYTAIVSAGLAHSAARAVWTFSVLTPANRSVAFGYGLGPDTAVGSMATGNNVPHAALWTSLNAGSVRDLHPVGGATESNIIATTGTQHVGNVVIGGVRRAGVWNGNTAASFTSLHLSGYEFTYAQGTDGVHQSGLGRTSAGEDRALLWTGSAASAVVLNPPNSIGAAAYAMGGGRQVGWATLGTQFGRTRAGYWQGSAASWVLLDAPGPNSSSTAVAISQDGQTQAGYYVGPNGTNAAALWHSTPESFTSLHPGGAYFGSSILGTDEHFQAGWAIETGVTVNACVWEGSAASFTDLGHVLTSQYSSSRAYSVYSTPTDVWVFGHAYNPGTGFNDAILWHNTIPSPATATVLLGAACSARRHRLRKVS